MFFSVIRTGLLDLFAALSTEPRVSLQIKIQGICHSIESKIYNVYRLNHTMQSAVGCSQRAAKSGRGIILTTHSMEEAEVLCDRFGIFVDGQLVCLGTPKQLTTRYGGFLVCEFEIKFYITYCKHYVIQQVLFVFPTNLHRSLTNSLMLIPVCLAAACLRTYT